MSKLADVAIRNDPRNLHGPIGPSLPMTASAWSVGLPLAGCSVHTPAFAQPPARFALDGRLLQEGAASFSHSPSSALSAGWCKLAARWVHNPEVPGSNPGPAIRSGACGLADALQDAASDSRERPARASGEIGKRAAVRGRCLDRSRSPALPVRVRPGPATCLFLHPRQARRRLNDPPASGSFEPSGRMCPEA